MHHGLVTLCVALILSGCGVKQLAVNSLGDALAEGGDVYGSDPDPDLVREAIPFGLKTIEGLLETSPEHAGLRLAAARGFAGYAFLLQQDADLKAANVAEARHARDRAAGLFRRARDHALEGLAVRHPGFAEDLRTDRAATLAATDASDTELLYWAGASWAAALGADPGDLGLLAELPTAAALVERVLELDESFDEGAAHEFMIAYEAGRPGGDLAAARRHYRQALTLSEGRRASVHLALAESVAVQTQNLGEFRQLIERALAVDPDSVAELRLVNTVARRRAEWLSTRIPDLFYAVEPDGDELS